MKSERLLSLDILRGITIVGMILVNNPGTWESIYAPLRHAEWNGLTPTDLVFPFFMFIMGVSMSFALSRFDHHFSRGFIIKLVRRTVILFLLGLFLSWFSLVCTGVEQPFSHIRILGVLQRLALAYFFGSLLIVGVRRPANLAWISGIILAGYSIFQGLSVFNMLHMVVGGVVGAAVYAQGLAYYVPDNLARYGSAIDHVAFSSSPFNLGHYMEEFISQMMEISIKQIYGWVAYACIFLFLLLLLYDFPARRSLKNIPSWKEVAREVKNTFWRTTHTPSEKEK
jgi:predicted acyltransferase